MKQNELFELMRHFDASGLSRLEYEADGHKIALEKGTLAPLPPVAPAVAAPQSANAAASAAPAAGTVENNAAKIKAPLVGVFYQAASPTEAPFVKLGDKVAKGQVLCLIEAMKMINELPSPVEGVITAILAQNEDVVSFDQVLFEVTPC